MSILFEHSCERHHGNEQTHATIQEEQMILLNQKLLQRSCINIPQGICIWVGTNKHLNIVQLKLIIVLFT